MFQLKLTSKRTITSANESKAHLKCGRPFGSKDKIPQNKRELNNNKIKESIIDHKF